MANHTTGAQRRNKKMDEIWEKAHEAKEKVAKKMNPQQEKNVKDFWDKRRAIHKELHK